MTRAADTSPFALGDDQAYRRWRDWKLAGHPRSAGDLVVEVADPHRMSDAEHAALLVRIRKANMAVYAGPPTDTESKARVAAVDSRFGLRRLDANLGADEDGITALQVVRDGRRTRYIPYSDRPINWHTDGYYNEPTRPLRAMTLHCARAAAEGGENALIDPEIAYILIRDADPDWIAALMHPDAMTIPPNEDGRVRIREARTGPVFAVDAETGALNTRYTVRPRNVVWRDDAATRAAVAFLAETLSGESPHVFRHRLAAGQGLITNNVLHDRTGFRDHKAQGRTRLVYRARYLDRVAGSTPGDFWPEEFRP
jgi:alpha-ketoglutarate-dependent taurine dioxygenase